MKGTLLKNGKDWLVEVWEGFTLHEYPLTPESLLIRRCRPGLEVEFKTVEVERDGDILLYAKLLPGAPFVSDDFQIGPAGAFEMTDEMIALRKAKLKRLSEIANKSWEGCDGCTEADKRLWTNGFVSGALETEPVYIDWEDAYTEYQGVSDLHDFIDWAKKNFNITKK